MGECSTRSVLYLDVSLLGLFWACRLARRLSPKIMAEEEPLAVADIRPAIDGMSNKRLQRAHIVKDAPGSLIPPELISSVLEPLNE